MDGGGGTALIAMVPAARRAVMVLLIEALVVALPDAVGAPVRVLPPEAVPVNRVPLIPCLPLGHVPLRRSDYVSRRVGIIRAPAVLGTEKVIQDAV